MNKLKDKRPNTKLIGVSGVARAGKDYFAKALEKHLEKQGYRVKRFALAYALKLDLRDLVKSKVGIDTFTEDSEEKAIIRPLLVAWGKVLRVVSKGQYWCNKLEDIICEHSLDFAIITDIRYDEYEVDEIHFIKNNKGHLIHLTRRMDDGTILAPPNEDEAKNDPRMAAGASVRYTFPNFLKLTEDELNRTLDAACTEVTKLYV